MLPLNIALLNRLEHRDGRGQWDDWKEVIATVITKNGVTCVQLNRSDAEDYNYFAVRLNMCAQPQQVLPTFSTILVLDASKVRSSHVLVAMTKPTTPGEELKEDEEPRQIVSAAVLQKDGRTYCELEVNDVKNWNKFAVHYRIGDAPVDVPLTFWAAIGC